jgi:glycosyltransferase involved in cell wall biosynthesis
VIRVLYLSYDGMTDPLGQSQVLPYLKGLSSQGYHFTIISFEKEKRFDAGAAEIESICADHDINWHPLRYTKTPPVLSTLKDLSRLKKKIRLLQKQAPFSIVHCRSYITALVGLWMKKKWGVKFIFDMRGFWADERVEGGLWNLKNPLYKIIYRYFKKKEKQFLESADYTISLTQKAAVEIQNWNHIESQPIPIKVIPCCVDLDLFDSGKVSASQVKEWKRQNGIEDNATVISYIGSLGTWYLPGEMLKFFKRWLMKDPHAILLFVTQDAANEIFSLAAKAGIDRKSVRVQHADRPQMPLMIATADYSLFFIKPVFSKKASSPTKQAEVMAMGKPVICNSGIGDTDYIINKYNSGILVHEFSNEEYDLAIKKAMSEKFNPEKIRDGARNFFSLNEGVRRYAEVYAEIVNEEAG